MKILMINKFLHPNGGSETYIFKLGAQLQAMGHQVQYFGMEHAGRCVGNNANAYTADMDFHGGSKLGKLLYPFKTIYSSEARKKLRLVLEDFRPDVCHLNNFNYQLTPSIILEIVKWRKQAGQPCKIFYTAHDYQLVCPNHMCMHPATGQLCEKCLSGKFRHCLKHKCIHGSAAKSAVGMLEAWFWKRKGTYKYIDRIICCSAFMKTKLDCNPILKDKTVVMHNFVDDIPWQIPVKQDYVLYFGRFSREKGVATLLEVCRQLPQIPFVFAGSGDMEDRVNATENVRNAGFQTGDALAELIRGARFTVYPSEWYENCPFSVMESQQYATAVIGANIGGIPELIREGETGLLFAPGNAEALKAAILNLWEDKEKCAQFTENCKNLSFDTVESYCKKLYE